MNDKVKWCPLINGNCLGEECAWWVQYGHQCSIVRVLWELQVIATQVGRIR